MVLSVLQDHSSESHHKSSDAFILLWVRHSGSCSLWTVNFIILLSEWLGRGTVYSRGTSCTFISFTWALTRFKLPLSVIGRTDFLNLPLLASYAQATLRACAARVRRRNRLVFISAPMYKSLEPITVRVSSSRTETAVQSCRMNVKTAFHYRFNICICRIGQRREMIHTTGEEEYIFLDVAITCHPANL